jgi:hypothetical protein
MHYLVELSKVSDLLKDSLCFQSENDEGSTTECQALHLAEVERNMPLNLQNNLKAKNDLN